MAKLICKKRKKVLAKKNRLVGLAPGLNFINVLRTTFKLADPQSVKRYWWRNCIFYAFGIYERKTLVLLTIEILDLLHSKAPVWPTQFQQTLYLPLDVCVCVCVCARACACSYIIVRKEANWVIVYQKKTLVLLKLSNFSKGFGRYHSPLFLLKKSKSKSSYFFRAKFRFHLGSNPSQLLSSCSPFIPSLFVFFNFF